VNADYLASRKFSFPATVRRAREDHRRDGIPISDDIWKELTDLAASLGVSIEGIWLP
jgi:LDH2 family malate/lactate/ureidoglycolate dehydrogenase